MESAIQFETSDALEDDAWDAFLASTPLGQFQQSTAWARYKGAQGWRCLRVVGRDSASAIVGGFQLLWRSSRWGRIAYVAKGPVIKNDSHETCEAVLDGLSEVILQRRLDAVIVQPPDFCQALENDLECRQFYPDRFFGVIRAGLAVDVRPSMSLVERGFRRRTRQSVNQARRRGVQVAEGNEYQLGAFFNLMQSTCRRQRARPNPGSERELRELWTAFGGSKSMRLTFATVKGAIVAGQLALCFGRRVTLWKKGWTSDHASYCPNYLITFESLEWAHDRGYEICDFAGMNRELAEAVIKGDPLTAQQQASRDCYNLGFGGSPLLYPEPRIFLRQSVLRAAHQMAMRLRHGRGPRRLPPAA